MAVARDGLPVQHWIFSGNTVVDVTTVLSVKEVAISDGERRRRYVVCHNPDEDTPGTSLDRAPHPCAYIHLCAVAVAGARGRARMRRHMAQYP